MSKPDLTSPSGAGNMTTQDPLTQLRDIHIPDPISWWPPAPGWWVLGLLIITLLIATTIYLCRYHAGRAYRRDAIRELKSLHIAWQQNKDDQYFVQQTQLILRRTALSAFPREDIASLSGENWVAWLGCSGVKGINSGDFSCLGNELYTSKPIGTDIQNLYQKALQWLKGHRQKKGQVHA